MEISWSLLLIVGILMVPFLIRLMFRIEEYGRHVRYLKKEIARAFNEEESRRWQDRLTAVRWSFFTGLSPEIIKQIIIRRRKNGQKRKRKL